MSEGKRAPIGRNGEISRGNAGLAGIAIALSVCACGGTSSPPVPPPAPTEGPSASTPAPASSAPSSPDAASDAGAEPSASAVDAGAIAVVEDAGPPPFDMSVVEAVVKEHKDAVRIACWDKSKSTEKAYIGTITIRVGPTGKVVSAETQGTDGPASKCIDKQVMKWKFPPPNGTATVKAPIRLRRD
jgi:hypothetical protein